MPTQGAVPPHLPEASLKEESNRSSFSPFWMNALVAGNQKVPEQEAQETWGPV